MSRLINRALISSFVMAPVELRRTYQKSNLLLPEQREEKEKTLLPSEPRHALICSANSVAAEKGAFSFRAFRAALERVSVTTLENCDDAQFDSSA